MAFLSGTNTYTGPVGDATAYHMRGIDRIILRQKGGASKQQIKNHPNFELTRRNNEEWKACILAARTMMLPIHRIKLLADYNYSGNLHALCKSIQLLDPVNEKGRRSVLFSEGHYKLEGFSFCKDNTFESILRYPLTAAIDKEAGKAIVELPLIEPGINLRNPRKQPLYRFVFVLSAVANVVYNAARKIYAPVVQALPAPHYVYTDWHSWQQNCEAQQINLSLNDWTNPAGSTLLLAAGIEFGIPLSHTEVRMVKYAGTAKIMRML
jgi:hypothetical protein